MGKELFGIFLIGTAIFIGLGYALVLDGKERERLIEQCMNDGRKEYECRAMFRTNSQTTVMPIPMVIRR